MARQNSLLEYMTQSQRRPEPSPPVKRAVRSTRKRVTVVGSNDDDDDDGDEIDISSSDSEVEQVAAKRQRTTKTNTQITKQTANGSNDQEQSWIDKYRPKSVAEVAIHVKKLEEVRIGFSKLLDLSDSARLLILSGPAGSAKSAVISALACDHGYEGKIVEWTNPIAIESSRVEAFDDFLSGFRFHNQLDAQNKCVIIVEDLPNVMHIPTKQAFANSLNHWVNMSSRSRFKLPPVVLVITEVDPPEANSWTDAVITERILPRRLLDHDKVVRIKFQPTNITLTTKALKNIATKEALARKIPRKDLDQAIKEIAQYGDIRSSISSLEFWARWRSQTTIMSPMGREAHLDLFHAIGRVVYGSKKDKSGTPIKPDSFIIQSVLDDWQHANQDATLSLAIHENFPAAHSSRLTLACTTQCADWLSDSDVLIKHKLPTTASDIAVRGVRTEIRRHPINDKAIPFHRQSVYPREKKLVRAVTDARIEIDNYVHNRIRTAKTMCSRSDAVLLDGFYESVIAASNFALSRRRLTGKITTVAHIGAESTIDEDEHLEPVKPGLLEEEENAGMLLTDEEIEDSEASDF